MKNKNNQRIAKQSSMNNESKYYTRAKERVDAIKKFYKDLFSCIGISALLITINLLTTSFHWFWFPVIGMSIGLVSDYIKTFGFPFLNFLSPDWEEQKILDEMKRLKEIETEHKWIEARKIEEEELNLDDIQDYSIEELKRTDNKQYR